jgi:hypothetical protein
MRRTLVAVVMLLAVVACKGEAVSETGGSLVIGVLTVESSYKDGIERPRAAVPDTVQWWITGDHAWRIKTFAIDHDIHIHDIRGTPGQLVKLANDNTKKHYGDVLEKLVTIEIPARATEASINAALKQHGLRPNAEVGGPGWVFWRPDDAEYRTQSRPE